MISCSLVKRYRFGGEKPTASIFYEADGDVRSFRNLRTNLPKSFECSSFRCAVT